MVMESKCLAGIFIGLGNFLISSECFLSTSQLLAIMSVPWYSSEVLFILGGRGYDDVDWSWLSHLFYKILPQMTVLTVYVFLYGRAYLVS